MLSLLTTLGDGELGTAAQLGLGVCVCCSEKFKQCNLRGGPEVTNPLPTLICACSGGDPVKVCPHSRPLQYEYFFSLRGTIHFYTKAR